jgi:hypothetical protein
MGAAGVGALTLPVERCTESISLLRGSQWALSGWLAVSLDAGIVASELAQMSQPGTKAGERVYAWASSGAVATVLLSVTLNADAISFHAMPDLELPRFWPGRHLEPAPRLVIGCPAKNAFALPILKP